VYKEIPLRVISISIMNKNVAYSRTAEGKKEKREKGNISVSHSPRFDHFF